MKQFGVADPDEDGEPMQQAITVWSENEQAGDDGVDITGEISGTMGSSYEEAFLALPKIIQKTKNFEMDLTSNKDTECTDTETDTQLDPEKNDEQRIINEETIAQDTSFFENTTKKRRERTSPVDINPGKKKKDKSINRKKEKDET